jgi:hypothetical protein
MFCKFKKACPTEKAVVSVVFFVVNPFSYSRRFAPIRGSSKHHVFTRPDGDDGVAVEGVLGGDADEVVDCHRVETR